MSTARNVICLALLFVLAACGSDSPASEPAAGEPKPDAAASASEPAISPGAGVRVEGGELLLGATFSAVKQSFGEPPKTRDMGALGRRISYPDLHLSAMLFGSGDSAEISSVTAHPGFDEGAAEKKWIGASEAELKADLGDAIRDPFLGVWWYRERGIALEMKDGAVAGLTVFAVTK
jgi:hypothetical protein